MEIGFFFYLYPGEGEGYDRFVELVEECGDDLREACLRWLEECTFIDRERVTGFDELFMEGDDSISVSGALDVSPQGPGTVKVVGTLDETEVVYVYGNEYHLIDEFRGEERYTVKTDCGYMLGRGKAVEKSLVPDGVEKCPDCFVTGQRRVPGGGKKNIERQGLVQEMKRLGEALGKTPSVRDMEREGRHSGSTYKREFGSWNEAVKAAGMVPRGARSGPVEKFTEEDILSWITGFRERNGRWPKRTDVDEGAPFSYDTVYNRFGGVNEAVGKAKRQKLVS